MNYSRHWNILLRQSSISCLSLHLRFLVFSKKVERVVSQTVIIDVMSIFHYYLNESTNQQVTDP